MVYGKTQILIKLDLRHYTQQKNHQSDKTKRNQSTAVQNDNANNKVELKNFPRINQAERRN